ncbi:SemiSWEET family transporter, partial [Aeromonas sp. 600724]|uniref:SemiSWEET family transporter n=1 Tax=Aeromonas sp. 600724 TaxID=2712031 RepID=UPI003BA1D83F
VSMMVDLKVMAYFKISLSTRNWDRAIIKTEETRAISTNMYLVFSCGVLLWLIYGLRTNDMPITIANSITLALACAVLMLKLRNERN